MKKKWTGSYTREDEQKAAEKVAELEGRLSRIRHSTHSMFVADELREARAEYQRITFFTRDAAAKGAA